MTTLKDIRKKGDQGIDEKPLRPREQQFQVKYTDPDGKVYEGSLTSRIMDSDERLEVARIAARTAGTTWGNLPPVQAARIWMLANVAVQLRDPPEWADKWLSNDDGFLKAVYEECRIHETEFFRAGGREGGAGPEASRFSITPVSTSANPSE